MQTQKFIITVLTEKPVANLAELIGSRAWSISNVKDVSVQEVNVQSVMATVPIGDAV